MRMLWSSDHHTLHNNTPTAHILGNLDTFLFKDHDMAKVDIVLFGGDFFERMVERPNPDMYRVEEWASSSFSKIKKCKAVPPLVIFLAGTESHDMGQPGHFKFIAPEGLDFRYIDKLCIETYPQFDGLSIMYVPDNMGNKTPDEVWELALQVLSESGLEKVDLIAFHGAFDFQLVSQARHKAHLLERWETIVKYAIFAGHIHTPVQKGKLYTSGSFDRDKHGEEHPKGGYCVDLDLKTGKFNPVFWENKNALPYLTMAVSPDIAPEQLVVDIHAFIKKRKMPANSHLRVQGGKADIVNPVISVLSHDYPHIRFKADNALNKEIEVDDELFDSKVYEGITISRQNIEGSLLSEIDDKLKKHNISEAEALEVLREFL